MINDIELRQSILNELRWDSHVDASHVGVTATEGTVTLFGHVNSFPDIFLVRRAVRRVNGVRAIADDLTVQLPKRHIRNDTDIATSISHVIEHNLAEGEKDVIAEVDEGLVSLRGEVDWHHQRQHVQEQIARVAGVRNIANQITLRKRPTPDNVKEQIEDALTRNAKLESSNITVTVVDDEVILEGSVKAFYERNLVEAAAWHAPGVHKVTDKISVGVNNH